MFSIRIKLCEVNEKNLPVKDSKGYVMFQDSSIEKAYFDGKKFSNELGDTLEPKYWIAGELNNFIKWENDIPEQPEVKL